MQNPPQPWQELSEILTLAKDPLLAADCWLKEAKFSKLYPCQPNFDNFVKYLLKLFPAVDVDHNKLVCRPQLTFLPTELQKLLLEFLSQNSCDISKKNREEFYLQFKKHYENLFGEKCLHHLYTINHLNINNAACSGHRTAFNHTVYVTSISRKRSYDKDILTPPKAKRMNFGALCNVSNETVTLEKDEKFSEDPDTKEMTARKLKQLLENNHAVGLVLFLVEDCALFSDAFDTALVPEFDFSEAFFSSLCNCLVEKQIEISNISWTTFMQKVAIAWYVRLRKTCSRSTLQNVAKLCQARPTSAIQDFLVPGLHALSELSDAHVNLATVVAKQVLKSYEQVIFFGAILQTKWENVKRMDKVISLLQSFMNLKLKLETVHLQGIIIFLENYAAKLCSSFHFAKLLLSVIKINAGDFSEPQVQSLKYVLSCNKTTLRVACEAALTKICK
ncbi:unnamed protein product [Clavelina lepadiformis]|uniref:Fanconi Anaemia group E protein C-terminal domain-containing protein n=1 Tax=Clavelina lepadiformis TaxID=159417 RepID=A0ABP0FCK4_CLALP